MVESEISAHWKVRAVDRDELTHLRGSTAELAEQADVLAKLLAERQGSSQLIDELTELSTYFTAAVHHFGFWLAC